jgi:hypothetical protein
VYLLQVKGRNCCSWILRQYFHGSVEVVRLKTVRCIERRRARGGRRRMVVCNLGE